MQHEVALEEEGGELTFATLTTNVRFGPKAALQLSPSTQQKRTFK